MQMQGPPLFHSRAPPLPLYYILHMGGGGIGSPTGMVHACRMGESSLYVRNMPTPLSGPPTIVVPLFETTIVVPLFETTIVVPLFEIIARGVGVQQISLRHRIVGHRSRWLCISICIWI